MKIIKRPEIEEEENKKYQERFHNDSAELVFLYGFIVAGFLMLVALIDAKFN